MYYETTDGDIIKKGIEASNFLKNFFSIKDTNNYDPKMLIYSATLTDDNLLKQEVVDYIRQNVPNYSNPFELILMMILGNFSLDLIWEFLNSQIFPIRNLEIIKREELKFLIYSLSHLKNLDLRFNIVDERVFPFIINKSKELTPNLFDLSNTLVENVESKTSKNIEIHLEFSRETILENCFLYLSQNIDIENKDIVFLYKTLLDLRLDNNINNFETFYLFKILNFDNVKAISKEIIKLQRITKIEEIYPLKHRLYLIFIIFLTLMLPFVINVKLPLIVYTFEGLYGIFLTSVGYFLFKGEILFPNQIFNKLKSKFKD